MTVRRSEPFTWVTWLPKLLIGDDSCEWAAWFRTHYQDWARPPEDMDWTTYRMEHTSLLRSFRDEIKAEWDEVLTEKQNQFYYHHPSGLTLSGKPDLVAIRGDEGLVIDIKSGQPRGAHRLQVMTYMHCLPQSHAKFEGKRLDGLLVYEQRRDDIKNYELDGFTDKLDAFLQALSGETPLTKVPSAGECRFCNIDAADCEDRMSTEFDGEDS